MDFLICVAQNSLKWQDNIFQLELVLSVTLWLHTIPTLYAIGVLVQLTTL